MTKAQAKTYDHFDDIPVVPRLVTYAPTRDGRQRWAVRVTQLGDGPRIGEGVPFWHTWNRELAAHFEDRLDTVVHVGGLVTYRTSVTYVTITSTRFNEVPRTSDEWDELHDTQRQFAILEQNFDAPTSDVVQGA